MCKDAVYRVSFIIYENILDIPKIFTKLLN
jgi:hypothetical protein